MAEIFNLGNIIGALITSFALIFSCSKILGESIDYRSIKYYVANTMFAVLMVMNYLLINKILRIIVLIIIMTLVSKILFSKSYKERLIAAFLSELFVMVGEIVLLLILLIFHYNNAETVLNSFATGILANLAVLVSCIILSQLKITKKVYNFIYKLTNSIDRKLIVFIMLVFLISINFIFLTMYYKFNLVYVVAINIITSIIYLAICLKILLVQDRFNKITNKYSTTLNSLKEYEEILDVYRVSNHENKNQLLTIRSMIVKKEKNIPEYIDRIIDNNIKDDEKLMFDTNAIPAGGLRAVIYSKLLVMKDKKIKFKLNVDRKVRTIELIDLGEDLMLDVCKVIGVFLDNAIEAVINLKKKNISINLFTDGESLNIEISNNFQGDIDLTKIDDKGYTSKTKGHGYGLSLVKEIISKNDKLKNERKINKDIFVQNLKIKIK